MDTSDHTTIALTRGQIAFISPEDTDLKSVNYYAQPSDNGTYYAARHTALVNGKRKIVYLHQDILSRMLGRELLHRERVDHINGNRLDCTRSNLRLATNSQNQHNRGKNKSNRTGYKGVTRIGNSYMARISVNGKAIHLGSYPTPELAAVAYDEAAIKYHKDFARHNRSSQK